MVILTLMLDLSDWACFGTVSSTWPMACDCCKRTVLVKLIYWTQCIETVFLYTVILDYGLEMFVTYNSYSVVCHFNSALTSWLENCLFFIAIIKYNSLWTCADQLSGTRVIKRFMQLLKYIIISWSTMSKTIMMQRFKFQYTIWQINLSHIQ